MTLHPINACVDRVTCIDVENESQGEEARQEADRYPLDATQLPV